MNNLESYILNGRRVWRGHLNKINGHSLTAPASFVIRPLGHKDAAAMGELSADIYRHLNRGEECFIHHHDQSYYNRITDNQNIVYIGVFRGDQLIAMSNLTLCRTRQEFATEIPASPIDFFKRRNNAFIAALGADCVRPQYRGNELNAIMISCRIQMAKDMGCTDAAAIIDRRNHWNMPPYFSNNFNMFASGIDPSDGGAISLLHHDLFDNQPPKTPHSGISIPYQRFDIIDRLLAKGFIGKSYNRDNASITFIPSANYSRETGRFNIFPTPLKQMRGINRV